MHLRLADMFSSHMVLQQGQPLPIWGTASPGATISLTFGKQRVQATASQNGDWMVKLEPLTATSTPATMLVELTGVANEQITLEDVVVGEVWVCSGQSNMEWPVSVSKDAANEIASANHPSLRLFKIDKRRSDKPEKNIPGSAWEVCTPETIPPFSAVAFSFGREVQKHLNVPIGLIGTSWGGTLAEAWTSRQMLLSNPVCKAIVDAYDADKVNFPGRIAKYQKEIKELEDRTSDRENLGYSKGWADVGEPSGDWIDMQIPGAWQARGLDFSGILWFRKAVEVPADWAGKELKLSIGATDKSDITYFNNAKVGSVTLQDRGDAWSFYRTYTVPGHLVKAGKNIIAVRVHSNMYHGGMTGPADVMSLSCPALQGSKSIPLAGTWKYTVEANYGIVQPPAEPMTEDSPHVPSCLFNAMIHPILPYPVRGAIWYQGESNAGQPKQYRTLFSKLIEDWRNQWKNPDLAFHFVQLANWMAIKPEPAESSWAETREAQAMALRLPNTGMAVTIDIGDADDIHPRNKQDVGKRLAYNALHTTYGKEEVIASGPLFTSVTREGDTLRVRFDRAQGLTARGGELKGFAIAGADKKYVWANARIDGEAVIVSADSVRNPVSVRYAWADNPICNLYNGAGLPASPFRSDPD